MIRKLESAIFVFVLILLIAVQFAAAQQPDEKFESPDVLSATDISYPMNTTTTGLVTLAFTVAANGHLKNPRVLRDTPPLTSAAQSAIRNWTFKAAYSNGQSVASLISVSVVFNPFNPSATAITGLSLTSPTPAGAGATTFVPPQITSASYAIYPSNSLATGTVVLSLTVGKSGDVHAVRVVHGVAALTSSATQAVKAWKYNAGTLNGQPVTSKLIVAFVFQRNLS
jgi:TonB family protein